MKNTFLILCLLASLAGTACKGTSAQDEATKATAAEQASATDASQQLAYVCPMECEGSASQVPGKCPVCGMDLEKKSDQATTANSAAHKSH